MTRVKKLLLSNRFDFQRANMLIRNDIYTLVGLIHSFKKSNSRFSRNFYLERGPETSHVSILYQKLEIRSKMEPIQTSHTNISLCLVELMTGIIFQVTLAIQKTRLGNSFVANQAKNLCPFRVNFLKLKLTPKEKKALTLVNS